MTNQVGDHDHSLDRHGDRTWASGRAPKCCGASLVAACVNCAEQLCIPDLLVFLFMAVCFQG